MLTCPDRPVLAVLSQLLFPTSYQGCPSPVVQSKLPSSSYHVLAVCLS
jgi:hypothetical protein